MNTRQLVAWLVVSVVIFACLFGAVWLVMTVGSKAVEVAAGIAFLLIVAWAISLHLVDNDLDIWWRGR